MRQLRHETRSARHQCTEHNDSFRCGRADKSAPPTTCTIRQGGGGSCLLPTPANHSGSNSIRDPAQSSFPHKPCRRRGGPHKGVPACEARLPPPRSYKKRATNDNHTARPRHILSPSAPIPFWSCRSPKNTHHPHTHLNHAPKFKPFLYGTANRVGHSRHAPNTHYTLSLFHHSPLPYINLASAAGPPARRTLPLPKPTTETRNTPSKTRSAATGVIAAPLRLALGGRPRRRR